MLDAHFHLTVTGAFRERNDKTHPYSRVYQVLPVYQKFALSFQPIWKSLVQFGQVWSNSALMYAQKFWDGTHILSLLKSLFVYSSPILEWWEVIVSRGKRLQANARKLQTYFFLPPLITISFGNLAITRNSPSSFAHIKKQLEFS